MGDADAQVELGKHYTLGSLGCKEDAKKGAEYFEMAAKEGHIRGMFEFGRYLFSKLKDEDLGNEWGIKALDSGDDFCTGYAYYRAMFLPQDYDKSVLHFTCSADGGDMDSQAWLGFFFQHGYCGILKSEKDAILWYEKSAKQGVLFSQRNLGSLFMQQKKYKDAWYWLKRAGNQGSMEAKKKLESACFKEYPSFDAVERAVVTLLCCRKFRKHECGPLGWLPFDVVCLIGKELTSDRANPIWNHIAKKNVCDDCDKSIY